MTTESSSTNNLKQKEEASYKMLIGKEVNKTTLWLVPILSFTQENNYMCKSNCKNGNRYSEERTSKSAVWVWQPVTVAHVTFYPKYIFFIKHINFNLKYFLQKRCRSYLSEIMKQFIDSQSTLQLKENSPSKKTFYC